MHLSSLYFRTISTSTALMLSSSCLSLGSIRNRNESSARYVILFAVMVSKICVWYSYSLPFPMIYALDEYMGNNENYEFLYGLMFSVNSFPNIFLPLIYFVDRYGPVLCGFVFSGLIFIGSVFFAVGVAQKSWALMLIGRFVFGVGGMYSIKTILAQYFTGKEIALAFGLAFSASTAGIAISNVATIAILDSSSIVMAAWMGAILTGISTVILFIAYLLDLRVERQIQITIGEGENTVNSSDPVVSSEKPGTEISIFSYQDLKSLPKIFWVLALLVFLVNSKIFQTEDILY